MQIALIHSVSPRIHECELTHREREPIDGELAANQHAAYGDTLRSLGLNVIQLDVNRDYPDSVFIEDTAVVVDEVAVMTRPGVESRRGEVRGIERELAKYREIARLEAPATLDGGDVLIADQKVFVGLSGRTNTSGMGSLAKILYPRGYDVHEVHVRGVLHLKSACTALDPETIIADLARVDTSIFERRGLKVVPVERGESQAANTLAVGHTVLMSDGYPYTAEKVATLGYQVKLIDNRELEKAEGGLTCCSLIFTSGG